MSIESKKGMGIPHSEKIGVPRSMEKAFDELKQFKEGKSVVITESGKFGNFILKEGVRGTITKLEGDKVTVRINYFGTEAELEIPKSKLEVSF